MVFPSPRFDGGFADIYWLSLIIALFLEESVWILGIGGLIRMRFRVIASINGDALSKSC